MSEDMVSITREQNNVLERIRSEHHKIYHYLYDNTNFGFLDDTEMYDYIVESFGKLKLYEHIFDKLKISVNVDVS